MGFAGNTEPQFVIPTVVANSAAPAGAVGAGKVNPLADMDFYIGDEAYSRKDAPNYLLNYPVTKGRIENWDDMEKFFHQALHRHLRCTPEDHNFLLTEPPYNTPENREMTAEIMFETFNVKGLNIGVQAVLALYAQWMNDERVEKGASAGSPDLTGLVVDSGDGLTHVIPVAGGYVISSGIKEIPLAGRHVTEFVAEMIKDRGETVPPEQRLEAARQIKEQHSFVCRDIVEQYQKFDKDPAKHFKAYNGKHFRTGEPWSIQIGYERFLAPEIFFHPEIFSSSVTTTLPTLIDSCIAECPMDYRRRLYSNIVLSGGSTTFTHFKERLQFDIQGIVDFRIDQISKASGRQAQPIAVEVKKGRRAAQQRFAAWLGGSLFAAEPSFVSQCKTKRQYDEEGPSCMRSSPVLLG